MAAEGGKSRPQLLGILADVSSCERNMAAYEALDPLSLQYSLSEAAMLFTSTVLLRRTLALSAYISIAYACSWLARGLPFMNLSSETCKSANCARFFW